MRYIIGIDLGTTNSACFYVDTAAQNPQIKHFFIPQITFPGLVESKELLPSFCYFTANEFPKNSCILPWEKEDKELIVGSFAKESGGKTPTRSVSSAKSWLCNSASHRSEKILPVEYADPKLRLSPIEASSIYLRHIANAWNHEIAKGDASKEFAEQDIILSVPASFDEVARVLTVEAATLAGIRNLTLIEEPQAAFYSWILSHEKSWQDMFKEGDSILVVDVGGGTTDFSLIEFKQKSFERMAVGNHLLLGGDNMDAALAHSLKEADSSHWTQLVAQVRSAKEKLLLDDSLQSVSLFLQGSGSKVIAGSKKFELHRADVENILKEGFFKEEPLEEALQLKKRSGLRSMGLAFEAETSITKHLAEFLARASKTPSVPTHVLFNGGCMKPKLFRDSILRSIGLWFNTKPIELNSDSLDLAVARGSTYFGKVKRGLGVKIYGGIPRTYYLQIQCDNQGKIDTKALTLMARGSEEGTEYSSKESFLLQPNTPTTFQLLSSNTRLHDQPGDLVEIKEDTMQELAPIQTACRFGQTQEKIPVNLHVKLSNIGTLQLWLQSEKTEHKWLLEFQVRSATGSDAVEKKRVDETFEVGSIEPIKKLLKENFKKDPKAVFAKLEEALAKQKSEWAPSILRSLFEALLEIRSDRKLSLQTEMRFWNIAGFLLRPGFGYPLDDYRIKELWKVILEDLCRLSNNDIQLQKWICLRRIAGGLSKGQQVQIASPLISDLYKILEGKIKVGPNDYSEMIRLIVSLELLDNSHKERLGSHLLKKLSTGKYQPVDIWALGRLGARHLFSGSVANVLPSKLVAKWLEEIIQIPMLGDKERNTLILQLGRKVATRELNIPETTLSHVLEMVKDKHLKHLLTEVVPLEIDEEEALFGEQLPVGLTLKT